MFICELIQQEIIADHISKIFLKSNLEFKAGQYIHVYHDENRFSPLSIASVPNGSFLEIHLSHPPENKMAQEILFQLKEKKQLMISGPFGHATIENLNLTKPIIFIARETGFAPIKSIIEQLLIFRKHLPTYLYWSGENYLAELPKKWMNEFKNFSYMKLCALTKETILEKHPDLSSFQVYAVDAKNNIYEMLFAFMEAGLSREDFFSDVI